jgi:hypothetical protein
MSPPVIISEGYTDLRGIARGLAECQEWFVSPRCLT